MALAVTIVGLLQGRDGFQQIRRSLRPVEILSGWEFYHAR